MSCLPTKRRACEPNFVLLLYQPSGEHGPAALTLSGHKWARSASMLSISLYCPKKRRTDPACVLHSIDGSGPCEHMNTSKEEMPLPPKKDFDKETFITLSENWVSHQNRHKRELSCCFLFPFLLFQMVCEDKPQPPTPISSKNLGPLRQAGSSRKWNGNACMGVFFTTLTLYTTPSYYH